MGRLIGSFLACGSLWTQHNAESASSIIYRCFAGIAATIAEMCGSYITTRYYAHNQCNIMIIQGTDLVWTQRQKFALSKLFVEEISYAIQVYALSGTLLHLVAW